jgi:hypothetical protein
VEILSLIISNQITEKNCDVLEVPAMQAKRIAKNGTIGIFCPSHIAEMERYDASISAMKRLWFNIKFGDNIQKDT